MVIVMYRVPETRVLRFECAAWRNGSKASKETVPYCNTAVRKLKILVKNEENQHFVLEKIYFSGNFCKQLTLRFWVP